MSQVINTNSLSLMTQNNMNKSQSALGTAIERLSSGLRINSAKDDAAGQAIANRFTSNIKGLTQAARNANDGISIAQTTEGSLSEINNNLQRIRELSVQATNGTNSQSDLDSIQDEISSRLSEIDRVSGQTQFNGVKVLSADSSLKIQVGSNDGETISIDLKKITSDTLGLTGFNVNGKGSVANTAATAADLSGTGFAKGATTNGVTTYTQTVDNTAATSADVLAKVGDGDTVTYTGTDTGLGVASTTAYTYDADKKSYSFDATGVSAASAASYMNPSQGSTTSASVTIGGTKQDVIIAKDGSLTAADDGAALYLDTTGNLTKNSAGTPPAATLTNLAANTGANAATISTASGTSLVSNGTTYDVTDASISADNLAGVVKSGDYDANIGGATYTVTAGVPASTYVGDDGELTASATTDTDFYLQANGAVTKGNGDTVYKTAAGKLTTDAATTSAQTKDPLAALDSAIASIDNFRSSLGAVQNRLDSAITNLNNTTTNLSSAQSRIQDADYATEVSNMSKAQILQQAGNSVLAKANQVPQQVLSLLQG